MHIVVFYHTGFDMIMKSYRCSLKGMCTQFVYYFVFDEFIFVSEFVRFGGGLGVEARELEGHWAAVMGRYDRGVKKLVVDTLRESQYPLEKLAYAVSQMSPTTMRETADAIENGTFNFDDDV